MRVDYEHGIDATIVVIRLQQTERSVIHYFESR